MKDVIVTLAFVAIGIGGAWLIEKFITKFSYRDRW